MILVVAGRGARRPLGLAGGAAAADLTVLEPSGLSVPGWAHDPEAPGDDRMALGGEVFPASRLTAVITAIDAVRPFDLPHVRTEDRAFVAAEMTAFLRSLLVGLACPVIDRPVATALSGPAGDSAVWWRAACALGIPDHRRNPVPRLRSHAVTVAGGRVVGPAPEPAAAVALALAAAAGVTAARLTISDDPHEPALCDAVPWWHAPSPPVLRALLEQARVLSGHPAGVSR